MFTKSGKIIYANENYLNSFRVYSEELRNLEVKNQIQNHRETQSQIQNKIQNQSQSENDNKAKKNLLERARPITSQIILTLERENENKNFEEIRKIKNDSINSSFFKEEYCLEINKDQDQDQDIDKESCIIKSKSNLNENNYFTDEKNSKEKNYINNSSDDEANLIIRNLSLKYSSDNSNKSKKKGSLFKNGTNEKKPLITENDNLFEEIFRKKLLRKAEEENYMLNLIHFDELKIPFPENSLDFDTDKYTNNAINKISNKLNGKFIIEKGLVDTISKDNVLIFINRRDEDEVSQSNKNKTILLENNFISNKHIFNNYVGINFKLINKDLYGIYYLFAIEDKH
jgi:hypothetical protein